MRPAGSGKTTAENTLNDAVAGAAQSDPARALLMRPWGATDCHGAVFARTAQMPGAEAGVAVRQGDRGAAQVEKAPEALVLCLAAVWVGAVLLPPNPACSEPGPA